MALMDAQSKYFETLGMAGRRKAEMARGAPGRLAERREMAARYEGENPYGASQPKQAMEWQAEQARRAMAAEEKAKEEARWGKREEAITQTGEAMERGAQTAYDRSLAEARARMGTYGSAGYGTAGGWEASRLALEREGMAKQMDIGTMFEQFYGTERLNYLRELEGKEFQREMMEVQYIYNKKLAEMNQPSWWETVGSFVGMIPFMGGPYGLALWGGEGQ